MCDRCVLCCVSVIRRVARRASHILVARQSRHRRMNRATSRRLRHRSRRAETRQTSRRTITVRVYELTIEFVLCNLDRGCPTREDMCIGPCALRRIGSSSAFAVIRGNPFQILNRSLFPNEPKMRRCEYMKLRSNCVGHTVGGCHVGPG